MSSKPFLLGSAAAILGAGYWMGSCCSSNSDEVHDVNSDLEKEKHHTDPKWLDNWELYYHPAQWGGGRGQYVRYLLLLGGATWTEPANKSVSKDGNVWGGVVRPLHDFPRVDNPLFPCFAPPWVVHNGNFLLSQTPTIVRFLAKIFGLLPENEQDIAHADQVSHQIYVSKSA